MSALKQATAPEQALVVGRITSVYGVKGWVKLYSHTEPMLGIFDYPHWWLKTSTGWKQIELDQGRTQGRGLVASIKGYTDRDIVREICGQDIYIDVKDLPELDEGDFYWSQLEGLTVTTKEGVLLGKVSQLMETGANDVVVVRACEGSYDREERLIPYVPETYILDVNLESKEMVVDWDPEF
ncbi:ribosome maturation factor RimM [Marinomonas balearica]|uniref:Ribosome maturation factor RimM n=1 Tax=Marinomonas balearica TaxID=491947 RepID=A0A4R6MHS1_9GAMM|nr:ribosome maturation factor RimM [Marinomonas balearica]TDP01117.1 16S rRNA processing protein RimM [Marinomonas balearica]